MDKLTRLNVELPIAGKLAIQFASGDEYVSFDYAQYFDACYAAGIEEEQIKNDFVYLLKNGNYANYPRNTERYYYVSGTV